VRSDELAVQQLRPAPTQRRHQPGERDFRRVGPAGEHRFAAERPVEPDAVQAADKLPPAIAVVLPAFDRVRLAQGVQLFVARLDAMADPAPLAVLAGGGAGFEDIVKGGVAGDGELAAPQGPRQRMRKMEAVQRQDRPQARLYPEHLWVVAPVRHREYPAAIGQHQQFGSDDLGRVRRVHRVALADRRRDCARGTIRIAVARRATGSHNAA